MAAREKISIDVKIAKAEENVIKTKEKYAEAVKKAGDKDHPEKAGEKTRIRRLSGTFSGS